MTNEEELNELMSEYFEQMDRELDELMKSLEFYDDDQSDDDKEDSKPKQNA